MTEGEAQAWIADRCGAAACDRIVRFLDHVIAENGSQNLISPASIATIWSRHAVDSAQLATLAPMDWKTWLDVGTGGGFPGMVIALLAPDRVVTMVEPRRKRATFLQHCSETFALRHARIAACKIEQVSDSVDVISARAVASVENLLRAAGQCAKTSTTWLLPRGRSGKDEVALLKLKRSMFHVEQSLTDFQSTILIVKGDGR